MIFLSRNTLAPASLKKDWMQAGLFFVFFIGSVFALLYRMWDTMHAWRWLGLAFLFGAWQLAFLWRNLPLNRRADEKDILPNLGWANALSFARGIFIAALFGFLFSPWPEGWLGWLPFTVYLFAALSDLLDGYLARITNHVTELGAALDMENDSWGVLIVTGLAFWYGQVPVWYLPVGLARYIFLFALWLREKEGKENYTMPFSYRRRIFAGVQMGFIVAVLAPLYSPPATHFVATLFSIPFLIGFLYDWGLVSGRIIPEKGADFFDAFSGRSFRFILFLLRIVTGGILAYFLFTQNLAPVWNLIFILLGLLLGLGLLGRFASMLMLIFLGLLIANQPLTGAYPVLFVLTTTLFFTGTGIFSIWSPEDWLIYNRAGGWDD